MGAKILVRALTGNIYPLAKQAYRKLDEFLTAALLAIST
jgi:hypothetical protein